MPSLTPRLPLPLQFKILDHLYRDNALNGGADFLAKMKPLLVLENVCKTWRERNKNQKFAFAILPFQWFANPRTHSLNFDPTTFTMQLYEGADVLPMLLRMDFDAPKGQALDERDSTFKRHVERALKIFEEVPQLQLEMRGVRSGSYSDLVGRFIRLKKLTLSSRVSGPDYVHLSFPPKPSLRSLPSTLVRLDLVGLVLEDWTVCIPSCKILTLDHVKFGSLEVTSDQTSRCCRNFFDSFPSLDAIAFNKVGRLCPDALSRMKVYGITQLRLGPCVFECMCDHGPTDPPSPALPPFSHSLARYFRCKVRHLTIPAKDKAALLNEILSSRSDQPHPPYLSKVQTVSLHSFPFADDNLWLYEVGKQLYFRQSRKLLDKSDLNEVELKWVDQQQREMIEWEPRSCRSK